MPSPRTLSASSVEPMASAGKRTTHQWMASGLIALVPSTAIGTTTLRGLDPQAEEGEEGLEEHHGGDGERQVHDHDAQHVRHDVAHQDVQGAGAHDARGLDELQALRLSTWPRTARAMVSQ